MTLVTRKDRAGINSSACEHGGECRLYVPCLGLRGPASHRDAQPSGMRGMAMCWQPAMHKRRAMWHDLRMARPMRAKRAGGMRVCRDNPQQRPPIEIKHNNSCWAMVAEA